jgi:hypothetical protein
MSKTAQFWLNDGPRQLLNWWTAPRNFGLKAALVGLPFLLAPNSIDWAILLVGQFHDGSVNVSIRSANLPSWLTVACYAIGGILVVGGVALGVIQHWQDRRTLSRRRVAVVEFRGMLDTTDTPLMAAAPAPALSIKEEVLLDVRAFVERGAPEIDRAIDLIARLPERLKEKRVGRDRSDVTVVAGGMMPVPLQVYAGFLLDDEAALTLMDWSRHNGRWGELNQSDDEARFEVDPLPDIAAAEVVVAVSASYSVDVPGIGRTFGKLPLVGVRLKEPVPNALWSSEKQQGLAQQFLEVVAQLSGRGVKRIHLILAAPSSLCIRLGSLYDRRNLPELVIYQYEKSNNPPYPWGLLLPTHGIAKAQLIAAPAPTQIAQPTTMEEVCPALTHI